MERPVLEPVRQLEPHLAVAVVCHRSQRSVVRTRGRQAMGRSSFVVVPTRAGPTASRRSGWSA
jgi:hypothetical protein